MWAPVSKPPGIGPPAKSVKPPRCLGYAICNTTVGGTFHQQPFLGMGFRPFVIQVGWRHSQRVVRWASVDSSTLCSASLHNVGQKSPFISSDSRHLQQIRRAAYYLDAAAWAALGERDRAMTLLANVWTGWPYPL